MVLGRDSSSSDRRFFERSSNKRFYITMENQDNSCSCEKCRSACKYKPGWFMPDQIKVLANNMGITIEELFKTKLAVDWWEAGDDCDNDIFVLAPVLKSEKAGTEYLPNPRGRCVFFTDDGKCEIHKKGKPFECKKTKVCKKSNNNNTLHKTTALKWNSKENQDMIVNLLGRTPKSSEYFGFFDMFP